ncbi:ROK family transcriptional regulator [Actinotalea sp. M2MS4P-6]|uniref:ROK family transcriptional regulator n=1 Tax=Actinotalea sp. M2MS4P-6 TaxID=2983762 RepID=UPI0021E4FB8D|nr:ROK family transcriptional regulator [Actinotalea sp. M2MS4P-6]MCV2394469.1 ROK family transcriptional regulator [Actinotalea sp. M2MS4P-6]
MTIDEAADSTARRPADAPFAWPSLSQGQRAVLLDLILHGPRSRAELTRRTELSRATLSRVTRDLVKHGLIEERGLQNSGRGRPSDVVALRPEAALVMGIELTGETVALAVCDLQGRVLETSDRPFTSHDVDTVLHELTGMVEETRGRHPRLTAVGVCLGADVRMDRGSAVVVDADGLGWDEVPLERLLSRAVRLPVAVTNNVQALTIAHHWFGVGEQTPSLAVIAVGLGIGAGIVLDGELLHGSRGHPGKVSHVRVFGDGRTCDHGHVGCASAYVTMRAMQRNTGHASFDDLVLDVAAHDAAALAAVRQAATALGVVIAQVVNLVDVNRVVLTGQARVIWDVADEALRAALLERLDPAAEPPELLVHPFATTDYAWGAAVSAIRHLV